MQRTWIIDLAQASGAAESSNRSSLEAVLSGFSSASLGEALPWWHYHAAGTAGWPGKIGLGPVIDAIAPPASPHAPRLDPDSATVFLIGSADESVTQQSFCRWAHGLASLGPADWLGAPGTIRRIGILRLPEALFKAARATDEALSAFLAQLTNVTDSFEALYLVADEKTSREFGVVEVPAADRSDMLAQLILHLSMPEPRASELPRGICSAGVFALHADWTRFKDYCHWRFCADLWRKFMHSQQEPFFNAQELETAKKQGKLEPATRPEDWRAAFQAAIPKVPDLPTELWSVPSDLSPWRIWSSKLLDYGGFFERWLRNWVVDLSRGNSDMSREVLGNSSRRLEAQEQESRSAVTGALRDDINLLAGPSFSARSRAQLDAFFLDAEQHVRNRATALEASSSSLFDFSSEPSVHEMLDKARKDVDEGRDKLTEAADLRGLTVRLHGHPSLLAMALRAFFASALLVMLVPPALAMLRAWKPGFWLFSLPPELWTAIAFLSPFVAMLLSVKYRHNHIGQHARKLTALALARLEKRVAELCSERLKSSFEKIADDVALARKGFLEFCDHLLARISSSQPSLSHPQLPTTAYQQPLLGGDDGKGLSKPTEKLQASSRDGVTVPYESLRDEDYGALLARLVAFSAVPPSHLAPDLDQKAGAVAVEDPAGRIVSATLAFAARELSFADENHVEQWREAAGFSDLLRREIGLRSAPSVEKQQGHDIGEGRFNRCSAGMELPGFHRDILNLDGYASWMTYNKFPSLASAIQNPQTVQATKAWLTNGLSQEPAVCEELKAPAAGVVSIEAEPWSRVESGAVLAKVGDRELRSGSSGFVVFDETIDVNPVVEGQVVGRIITFASDDPRLLALFEFTEDRPEQILSIGGGLAEGNKDRIETYRFLAREALAKGGMQP